MDTSYATGISSLRSVKKSRLRNSSTPLWIWYPRSRPRDVERFELPNLSALNFLLHGALGGGGTMSLMNDAQGKVFSTAILRMEIEVSEEVAGAVAGRGRVPAGWTPDRYGAGPA